jgi:hypothetical protein
MNLALIIPDGVGVRNFVLGKLLRILPEGTSAHVFHGVPDDLLAPIRSGINGNTDWHRMVRFRPGRLTDILQGSLSYAQMYWAKTVAMRHTLSVPIRGSCGRRVLQRTKKMIGWAVAEPGRMQFLEKIVDTAVRSTPEAEFWRRQFRSLKPGVVFCSQQLAFDAIPAVVAAKELGIPTAAFIFSWDNLTSKGRIVAPFDYYFVWSEYMKRELLHYYPRVSPDRVHIVGTPQFDPYADQSLILTREEFCSRLGADPARRLICYSGGDAGTCPEDPKHVNVLMELIRSGVIRGNPQVVLRPVPVDDGERYQWVRAKHPELIYSHPQWKRGGKGDWSLFFPMPEDIQLLSNLTFHADLNVNLGSTMTLDFGIHDKPVVNVAFDMSDPPIFGMPVYDFYYKYEHLQPVLKCKATRVARSPEQFAEFVNSYLENPSLDREGRRQLIELQIDVPLGSSTGRLIKALQDIAERRSLLRVAEAGMTRAAFDSRDE